METPDSIYIDATNHIVGKLATVIAKHLLLGHDVTVVHAERALLTRKWETNLKRMNAYLNKRTNYNPRKGPLHYRAPSEIVKRAVRRMLPKRTPRGKAAYRRLKTFDGVPTHLQKKTFFAVEKALRFYSVKPTTPITLLGKLAAETGWGRKTVLEKYEQIRRTQKGFRKAESKKRMKEVETAKNSAEVVAIDEQLEKFGY